ncbi:MAG: hypothetical protein WKF88_04785 [Ferruginibacter sp.]
MEIKTVDKGLAESLLKEYKTEDLVFCLQQIGVINTEEILISYNDLTPWQRGGAETYNATANIKLQSSEIKLIAKALISMATPPDRQLADWNRRRTAIKALGIATPDLFSSGNGAIYEAYIAEDFDIASATLPNQILEQLGFIAGKLDKSGFATIAFSRDLRHQDNQLYYVDFGSDLGEASNQPTTTAWLHLQAKLTNNQVEILRVSYDNSLNS